MAGSVKTLICGHKFGTVQVACLNDFAEKGKQSIKELASDWGKPTAFVVNLFSQIGLDTSDYNMRQSMTKEFAKELKAV